MKKIIPLFLMSFLLAACDMWNAQPQPFPVWTAIPSRTPSIITATPIILTPNVIVVTPITPTSTETPPPTIEPTFTPILSTETLAIVPAPSVSIDVLGCNTSIDIMHGMGEVTNAYVTVKNTGNADLPNTCALLRAIDEGREHPDKKVCVPNLPIGNQVTLKLTVDSTYKEGTIIQVDALSNDAILLRVDKQSCTDIGLFGGAPSDTGVVKPIE
ncbi:MAG: hypothetical protein PHQ36_00800 [Anaerolineales bacterium]|nr:hypothetical protein [Anaerolineales bacterium]